MTQLANIYLHSKTPRLESPTYRRFNQFKADDKLPLLQANIHKNQLNYQELLVAYQAKHGKPLKPVNHRQAFAFPRQTCPGCGAPSQYLYANGGGDKSSLLLCKICQTSFNPEKRYRKEVVLRCPDCQNKLELAKQRANFKVWRCNNRHCPHRKRELAKLNSSKYQEYLKRPSQFKLRYIYREYAFKIRQIAPQSSAQSQSHSGLTTSAGINPQLLCELWHLRCQDCRVNVRHPWHQDFQANHSQLRTSRGGQCSTLPG